MYDFSYILIIFFRFVAVYLSLGAVSYILKLKEKVSRASMYISLLYGLLYPLIDILTERSFFVTLLCTLMLFYLVNKLYEEKPLWMSLFAACLISLSILVLIFIFSGLLLLVGVRTPAYY
jgi:hypothetical protein